MACHLHEQHGARFIVLRDQDSHPDCTLIKRRRLDSCKQSGKAAHCLVRIACRELETVYVADLQAVENALEIAGLSRHQQNRKFRAPDEPGNPGLELKSLTKNGYPKVSGSRAIGKHLDPDNVRSPGFRNLIAALRRLETELLQTNG